MKENTYRKIIKIIRECSPYVEDIELSPESRLLEDLGYDSLSILELFEQIIEEFGVDCYNDPDVYDSLQNISTFVSFVDKLIDESGCMV